MAIHTTKKELLRVYGNNGLCVGYCAAQNLLRYQSTLASTSGIYGWNFDAYEVEGVLICTGYRGMIGKQPKHLERFEKMAEKIAFDSSIPYEKKKKKINALLLKWIKKEYERKV